MSSEWKGLTLTDALRAVWPHASRDKSFRLLMGVELSGSRVIATDRYTAGRAEFDPSTITTSGIQGSLWLRPELVKFILANRSDKVTHLDFANGRVTVGFESGVTYGVDRDTPLDSIGPTYPDLDRIFTAWKPEPERAALKFQSQYMNRVADNHFPGYSTTLVELGVSAKDVRQVRITKENFPWFTALLAEVRS